MGSPATPTELLGYFAPSDTNVFAGPSYRHKDACGRMREMILALVAGA
jgi:hypothetical protein